MPEAQLAEEAGKVQNLNKDQSGQVFILEPDADAEETISAATPAFQKYKVDFETGKWFLHQHHSISPLIANLHDKIFRIDNWLIDSPIFSEANSILSYMGLDPSTYDFKTNKIKRSNGTVVSIKKVDPYNVLQEAFADVNKPIYATVTGDPHARLLRLIAIKKHQSTFRNRAPNFKDESSTKHNVNHYLGGFNYDGLLLLSSSPDFSDLNTILASAQIKCLITNDQSVQLKLQHERDKNLPVEERTTREVRNNIRTVAPNVLVTDLIGKREITKHKAAFAKILKKLFEAVGQDDVTVWYGSDAAYKASNLSVLNFGYVRNREPREGENNQQVNAEDNADA